MCALGAVRRHVAMTSLALVARWEGKKCCRAQWRPGSRPGVGRSGTSNAGGDHVGRRSTSLPLHLRHSDSRVP